MSKGLQKQLRRLTAYVLLVAMFLTSVPVTDAYAAVRKSITDIEWIFSSEKLEEINSEEISLEANPLKDGVEVTGIRLPDGELVEGNQITMTLTENGTYDFVIYYDKEKPSSNPDAEPKILHREKEVSYKVKDLDTLDYRFTSEFTDETEREKKIVLEVSSDSEYSIAGIQTPDGEIPGGGILNIS